jgi:ubiquinone/menaquinone biosynthesis C-methylase UbiE
MVRTPEPELMTDVEQVADYAAADLSEVNGIMPLWFRTCFPEFSQGELLDLGCGAADMTIRFACAYPDLHATGIDGSARMLAAGRDALHRAGLSSRIALEQRLLPDPAWDRTFDAVVASSVLHHLPDPMSLWDTVIQTARPGAPVMVMDLRRPKSAEDVTRLVERYGAEARPALRRDFVRSLHAAYTTEEVLSQLDAAGLTDFEIREEGELHWLVWGTGIKTAGYQERGKACSERL